MLNYNQILDRIKKLLDTNNLNATTFSQKIGFQRSGVSHILSGRNKPSLDFISKIYLNFDNVSINWLLFGNTNNFKDKISESNSLEINNSSRIEKIKSKKIKKIIFIYEDESFDEYNK